MSHLIQDLRFAFRILLRRPALTLVVTVSLVLGLGLNTAIFTLIDEVFLNPVEGVAEPHRVHSLYAHQQDASGRPVGYFSFSYPVFQSLVQGNRSFSEMALYQGYGMNFTGEEEPERGTGIFVSEGYFRTLALSPASGRFFSQDEVAATGGPKVAVLSHGYWLRRYGADTSVLGRTLTVNGVPLRLIGVAPAGFRGVDLAIEPDVFIPITLYPELSPYGQYFDNPAVGLFRMLGRLAPDVDRAQAFASTDALLREVGRQLLPRESGVGLRMLSLEEASVPVQDRSHYLGYGRVLMGAAVLVLLIACLNIAGLLLALGRERSQELAIRRSLGAGQRRVAAQLLCETLLLFLAGGLLSIPVTSWSLKLLWKLRPTQFAEGFLPQGPEPRTFLVALLTALLCGVLFGLGPALVAARRPPASDLHNSRAGSTEVGRHGSFWLRPRHLMVMGQVALAIVALTCAMLFLRSLEEAYELDLGFQPKSLATLSFAPGEQGYEANELEAFYRQVRDEVLALPGVSAVALSENRLLRGAVVQNVVFMPGEDKPAVIGGRSAHRTNAVSSGFFATAGLPLLRGSDFDPQLTGEEPLQVIVNRTMAETLWPGQDAVGQQLHLRSAEGPPATVVGVASDAKYREISEAPQFFLYVPMAQNLSSGASLLIRTEGEPAPVLLKAKELVRSLAPELVLRDVDPVSRFVADAFWAERVSARLLGAFSLIALALVCLGVYGVTATTVEQRRHEIGVRMALGAGRPKVLSSVLWDIAATVSAGLLIGWLLAALLAWRFAPAFSHHLHGVSPLQASNGLIISLMLLATAFLSCLPSLRRALATDPTEVLRVD